MATKYEGLTTAQWASRIVEYNPGKFDKSKLIKHYTAHHNTMSLIVGLIMIGVYDSRLIVHYECTMSSYFPLRYDVHTYNHLNPV